MRPLALCLAPFLLLACGGGTQFTDTDVPTLPKLGDVMKAQSQLADPQMKKAGATAYADEDYAAFTALATRLKLTTARMKEKGLTRGEDFDKLADELATHATELADAAGAKDLAKSSAALVAMKGTCKTCHSKSFKEIKQ